MLLEKRHGRCLILDIIVIIIIGILVIGLPLLGLAIFLWWIVFPILGAWVGGWIGFFFGVGLAVVIYCIYLAIKGVAKDFNLKKILMRRVYQKIPAILRQTNDVSNLERG